MQTPTVRSQQVSTVYTQNKGPVVIPYRIMKMQMNTRIAMFYSMMVRMPRHTWQRKMPKYPHVNRVFLLNPPTVKMPATFPSKLMTPMMIVPMRGVKLPPEVILDRMVLEESMMISIPMSCLRMTCTKFTQLAYLYLALLQKASFRVTTLVSFAMVDLMYSLASASSLSWFSLENL